jgi:hypothetical protein
MLKISDKLFFILKKFDHTRLSGILLGYNYHVHFNPNINYLDITDGGFISYSDVRKIVEGVDPWNDKIRYSCKPGSFITKLLPEYLGNPSRLKEIEDFTNYIKTFSGDLSNLEFRLVSGNEIKKWYLGDNYISYSGNLGGSCMRQEYKNNFLNLYSLNVDNVQLLILIDKSDNRIYGRSLIWNLEDGSKFMDTIYTVDETRYQKLFLDWAKSSNFLVKEHQRCGYPYRFKDLSTDEIFHKHMVIKLKYWEFDNYPYMDTFKFLNLDNGVISNVPDQVLPEPYDETVEGDICLEKTDGGYYNNIYCVIDEYEFFYFNHEESIRLSYNDKRVYKGHTRVIGGITYHKNDLDSNNVPKPGILPVCDIIF